MANNPYGVRDDVWEKMGASDRAKVASASKSGQKISGPGMADYSSPYSSGGSSQTAAQKATELGVAEYYSDPSRWTDSSAYQNYMSGLSGGVKKNNINTSSFFNMDDLIAQLLPLIENMVNPIAQQNIQFKTQFEKWLAAQQAQQAQQAQAQQAQANAAAYSKSQQLGQYGQYGQRGNQYKGYIDYNTFQERDKSGAKIGIKEDNKLNAVSRYLAKDIWANK